MVTKFSVSPSVTEYTSDPILGCQRVTSEGACMALGSVTDPQLVSVPRLYCHLTMAALG